jgi:hypothetical protein
LDGLARQRSDCCNSGTSSCQNEPSASAGWRAGATGGGQADVAEAPLDHWPLADEGSDLAATAAGAARISSRKTRRSSSLQGMRE